jgi:hypothetical protein
MEKIKRIALTLGILSCIIAKGQEFPKYFHSEFEVIIDNRIEPVDTIASTAWFIVHPYPKGITFYDNSGKPFHFEVVSPTLVYEDGEDDFFTMECETKEGLTVEFMTKKNPFGRNGRNIGLIYYDRYNKVKLVRNFFCQEKSYPRE